MKSAEMVYLILQSCDKIRWLNLVNRNFTPVMTFVTHVYIAWLYTGAAVWCYDRVCCSSSLCLLATHQTSVNVHTTTCSA